MDNLFDLHIYTNNSPGGNDKVSFLCETAVQKGLRAIAFTDRCDIDNADRYDNKRRLRHSYFDSAKARQVFFDSLLVLSGVEFGQAIVDPAEAARVIASQQYDIVLTCVSRFANGEEFLLPYQMPPEEFNRFAARYAENLLATVTNTDFDVLSGVLKPIREQKQDFTVFRELLAPVFKEMIQKNKALELNTRDLLGSDRIRDLACDLLSDYCRLGGRYITPGSESYYCHDIGSGLEVAISAAKRCGFSSFTLFDKRIPYTFNI